MATAAPQKTKTQRLQEYASLRTANIKVDPERGVISGVKILGLESANGRSYTTEALRNAVGMYEGAKVNLNHRKNSTEPRDLSTRTGWLENVSQRADGLYGDYRYNPKHPLAESIAWYAENAPNMLGLSHDVDGSTTRRNGKVVVEAITKVNSVDLVADPATTKGLFESIDADAVTLQEVIDDSKPGSLERTLLTELLREAMPYGGGAMLMPQGQQPGANGLGQSQTAVSAAFASVASAIATDEQLGSFGERGKKIAAVGKALDGASSEDDSGQLDDEGEPEDKDTKKKGPPMTKEEYEAKIGTLQEQVDTLTKEKAAAAHKQKVAAEIQEAKVTLTEKQRAAFEKLEDEADRKALLESMKPGGFQKPVSRGQTQLNGAAKDTKSWLSEVTNN